jgi:AcrR family transcriptional regulator
MQLTEAAPGAWADRPAVRARVLQAALQLVHERGLQGVTQARVAQVAGVRQSHLTYYFPTRTDLIKAIAHEHASLLSEILGGESALPMSLQEFRKGVIERVRSKGMSRMMLTLVVGADEDPSLKEWLRKLDADIRRHFVRAFERCGLRPTQDQLHDFHCTIVGAAMLSIHDDTAAGSRLAARAIRRAFERISAVAKRLPAARRSSRK